MFSKLFEKIGTPFTIPITSQLEQFIRVSASTWEQSYFNEKTHITFCQCFTISQDEMLDTSLTVKMKSVDCVYFIKTSNFFIWMQSLMLKKFFLEIRRTKYLMLKELCNASEYVVKIKIVKTGAMICKIFSQHLRISLNMPYLCHF